MDNPTLTDYVQLIFNLFEQFEQERQARDGPKPGKPFTYPDQTMIVFFMIMHFRRIYRFKTQWRWLTTHPEIWRLLGWEEVPHRTTLSDRYKQLYQTVQQFIAFLGQDAAQLDQVFNSKHLMEDKSPFKAQGPVWHQKQRQAGQVPDKLRNLDTDATWTKSGYHGWVYGYGLHVTCNDYAFPKLVQVKTGAVPETTVIDQKANFILDQLKPLTLAADNGYAKATRIRRWAKAGVALLTPAFKWIKGRYAKAYHQFIEQPANALRLRKRATTVEPLFDLIAQVIGTTGLQKQLSLKRLDNVRTCLALGTLTVQLAMIVNNIWGLPLRYISVMASAFT